MSRHIIALSDEQLISFDLEAFVTHANTPNQHHREAFTTPFPKAPRRWLSHSHFTPRPIVFTAVGDIEGGRSGLVGATIDCSFTRASVPPTTAPEAARATIRPASSSWRWLRKSISTPMTPASVPISTRPTRAAAPASLPGCTTPSQARMT
jgi:hypothetical protein